MAIDDVFLPAFELRQRYSLFATDPAARMEIVEKVKTFTNIGFGKNIAESFGDFDGALNEEEG